MEEHRIRLTRRDLVTHGVSAVLWTCVTVYFAAGALADRSPWAIALVTILVAGLAYYLRMFSLTAVLRGDRLFVRNWFRTQEFDRAEIERFRVGSRQFSGAAVFVDLHDGRTKKLAVTDFDDMFSDYGELREEQAAALEEWRIAR